MHSFLNEKSYNLSRKIVKTNLVICFALQQILHLLIEQILKHILDLLHSKLVMRYLGPVFRNF
jgi:hypothetical protein